MKAVIQRVKEASVTVNHKTIGAISQGMVILLGVHRNDTERQAQKLAQKILNLRIFSNPEDQNKNIDKSILDIGGEILVISQFTLIANTDKGNRPSFIKAASPDLAERLYNKFVEYLRRSGLKVATGRFGAMMKISLVNDGPVTIILEQDLKQ